jgi:hypothetical protein
MPEKRDLLDTVFWTGNKRLNYPRKKTGVTGVVLTVIISSFHGI